MEGSPGKFSLEPSVVLGDSDCQERSPLSSISSLIHFSQKSVMPPLSLSAYFSGNDSIPLPVFAKDDKGTSNFTSALGFSSR